MVLAMTLAASLFARIDPRELPLLEHELQTYGSGLSDEERLELEEILWQGGRLRYLLWPDAQTRVYNFIHGWKAAHPNSAKPLVWNLHRGAGKSYLLGLLCIERALTYPGHVARLACESIQDMKDIVEPSLRKILDRCPPSCFPEIRKGDEEYWFRNPAWPRGSPPSVVHLIGCRERADRHRGKRSHTIAIDECRNIDAFEYVATIVFGPHFAKMTDCPPLFLMSSTPPESMDHPWSRIYAAQAEEDGRYIEIKASEDLDWTPLDDERMLELFRSKESPDWQREMECARMSDPRRRIVPEYDEKRHTAPTRERPPYFIPLATADGGFVDFFACLYGYIDWRDQKLVVEDSIVERGKNTGQLAGLMREKEAVLFREFFHDGSDRLAGDRPFGGRRNPTRHADMTPRELADLEEIYKLTFAPADKNDPDSRISVLRDRFHHDQIVILSGIDGSRNVELRAQLRNGIRNEKGKIERSEAWGHWDAGMAMAYMNRHAPWNTNPQPKDLGPDRATHDGRIFHTRKETRGILARQALRSRIQKRRPL